MCVGEEEKRGTRGCFFPVYDARKVILMGEGIHLRQCRAKDVQRRPYGRNESNTVLFLARLCTTQAALGKGRPKTPPVSDRALD